MHIRIIVDKLNCNQSFPLGASEFLRLEWTEITGCGFSKETLWGCFNTHWEQSLTSFWAKEAAGPQEALELGTVKSARICRGLEMIFRNRACPEEREVPGSNSTTSQLQCSTIWYLLSLILFSESYPAPRVWTSKLQPQSAAFILQTSFLTSHFLSQKSCWFPLPSTFHDCG